MSDMERQDYINQINSLQATIKNLLDMIDTLKQTLDSVSASNRRNEDLVKKLTAQIEELQRMVKNLEDRNRRHNKNTFGKKTHKANKKAASNNGNTSEEKGRDEEKEDFDGRHGNPEGTDGKSNQSASEDGKLDKTKVKSEHLDEQRGPRGAYTKMDAAKVTKLLCDISNLPKGLRFKEFREHNEYNKVSYVECVSYQIAILVDEQGNEHEYFVPADEALAAGRRPNNKFESALEISGEEDAAWFVNQIKYLYLVENENIIAERTAQEIVTRRAEKDVTDTLIALEARARELLRKKGSRYSDLMVTALNYMLNGWDELQNYRKDGRFTIDNLPAERAIRPVTVKRKNSIHHSSEEGMQMASGYMTIMGTATMLGYEAKDFLLRALQKAIYGDNDLESMLQPAVIAK